MMPMAFSNSFLTPDLAPATDDQQQGASENAATANMPHSDKTTPAPPSSDPVPQEPGENGNGLGNATKTTPKAAASKKKGTAAAVKGTQKRARPSTAGAGTKKGKGARIKKAKADASSKPPGAADAPADGDDSSESDSGPYCLCRGPDDHRFMIACDRCEDWFHGGCIGMDKHTGENLVQKYICPNCTDGGRYATRYKKTCSLTGCNNPARIYDSACPSIFCCPEHCQAWWEQLIATLPRIRDAADVDYLTQEEFMGLLDAPSPSSSSDDGKDLPSTHWKLGKAPFETPSNFWDLPTSSSALTAEEHSLLTTSATTRYQLGEEIVLCKKMLQLIDMALKRREAAVAAGRGSAKDLCGYDTRLDNVGAARQFALFLQSPHGEAIFKAGRLDNPPPEHPTLTPTNVNGESNPDDATPAAPGPGAAAAAAAAANDDFACMCGKKKCKPHAGWSAILTKAVKHDMKELAAQAKEMLDAEQRVRDGAAGRFRRRMKERNGVIVADDDTIYQDHNPDQNGYEKGEEGMAIDGY